MLVVIVAGNSADGPGQSIQWWVWCQGVVGMAGAVRGGAGSVGAGGVGGVEVGVEGVGVVGVALQGSDAVVMGAGQGVGDGVGEQRVGADLDEGGVVLTGGGDGLAEANRVAQVGCPIFGIKARRDPVGRVIGGADHWDGRLGRGQIGQRSAQFGQDRLDDSVMGGHIDLDAPGQPVGAGHHRDHRIDLLGRTGDHRLARRGVHRHTHLGVVGQQRLGGRGVGLQQRHRARDPTAAPSTATGSRSPAARRYTAAPRPPPPR